MPTARVDIILCVADRNDSRQISLLMNTCCEFFSCPKFLMKANMRTFTCVSLLGVKRTMMMFAEDSDLKIGGGYI